MSLNSKDTDNENKQRGILITAYKRFIAFIYFSIATGALGRFFTMYKREEKLLRSGVIAKFFSKMKNVPVFLHKITRVIANQFESSLLLSFLRRLISRLISQQIRIYGTFTFSFGVYSVISYALKRYFIAQTSVQYLDIIVGAILIIVSLPMFFSSKSVGELLENSVIMRSVLIEGLGISEESLTLKNTRNSGKYALPFLFGIIAGIITYFFNIIYVIIFFLVFIIISIVIILPEIGVLCVAFLTPAFSHNNELTGIINFFIIITAFSYFIKVIRGKRIIRFSLLDLSILFFGVLLLFGGIISAGGELSKTYALNSCLLLLNYFLIVNLIKTKEWMFRCTASLITSAVLISLIGLFGKLINSLYNNEIGFSKRLIPFIINLFDNTEVLALFLVVILPFTLSYFIGLRNRRSKFSFLLINGMMLATIIISRSPLVLYTLFIELIVFFLIYSKKSVFFFLLIPVTIPFITIFVPHSIINIFTNAFDLSAPATNSFFQTAQGVIKMFGSNSVGGIGAGTTAFENVFGIYALPTTEAASGAPNLILQIVSSLGIVGLIVFIFIVILFYQMNFEHLKSPFDKRFKNLAIACISSITAMLFAGGFYNIWLDDGLFWLFFTIVALSSVYMNVSINEKAKHLGPLKYDINECSIEISRKIK